MRNSALRPPGMHRAPTPTPHPHTPTPKRHALTRRRVRTNAFTPCMPLNLLCENHPRRTHEDLRSSTWPSQRPRLTMPPPHTHIHTHTPPHTPTPPLRPGTLCVASWSHSYRWATRSSSRRHGQTPPAPAHTSRWVGPHTDTWGVAWAPSPQWQQDAVMFPLAGHVLVLFFANQVPKILFQGIGV